jgi:hypothetical protein
MKRYHLLMCVVLLILTACEEPRLDSTSDALIEKTLPAIRASLDEEKQAKLDTALRRVALIEGAKKDNAGGIEGGAYGDKFKPRASFLFVVKGMTADEIIEFASRDSSHAAKLRESIKVRLADRTQFRDKVAESIEPAKARLQALLDRKTSGSVWEEAEAIHFREMSLGPWKLHGEDCECLPFNLTVQNTGRRTLAGMYVTYVITDKATGKEFDANGLSIDFSSNQLDDEAKILRPGETLKGRFTVNARMMLLPKDLDTVTWTASIHAMSFPSGSAMISPNGTAGLDANIEQAEKDLRMLEGNLEYGIRQIKNLEDAAVLLDYSRG